MTPAQRMALRRTPLAHSAVLAAVCALWLSGCGASFTPRTPPGFVELEQSEPYDYRATTADGLVIAVREIEHEPQGELSFWTQAINNRMRKRGGYALLDTKDVRNAQGITGKQLKFGHDEGSKPHLYYVTLFVTDDYIYLLESGGRKDLVEKHAKQLEWSVQNFHIE